jgi:pilus assembly protein Flp/PilA
VIVSRSTKEWMEGMTKLHVLYTNAAGTVRRFGSDQSGATAIEYAMIAAGVGAFIAATVHGLGSTLKTTFYDKIQGAFP